MELATKKYFQDHKYALLFCLYYDDYEIVNPIGSHRKNINFQYFTGVSLTLVQLFALKFKQPNLLVWQTHLI